MLRIGLGLDLQKIKIINHDHISIWDTTKTSVGSSTDHQIKIPVENGGTYDCVVFWGDGSSDSITTWNDVAWTHTYANTGIYRIKIKGQFEGFRFNNTGDRLKLLSIENGGKFFKLGDNNGYFNGCENLTKTDNLNTSGMTDMSYMYAYCYLFNGDVSKLNTKDVDTMLAMFGNCYIFNQDVSNFDTSKVTTMRAMFFGCAKLNQVINFNTKNVDTMYDMFKGCTDFNQDLSSLDLTKVNNMIDMLLNATSWSTANYDAFLISAESQSVQSGVTFACSSKYTGGGAAEAARTYLKNTKLWNITDLGAV
jgi:surface protein